MVQQMRIQDLVRGAPASEAESCQHDVVGSHASAGFRACLRAREAFRFLMLKYEFSHISEFFLSFLTSTSIPKTLNLY